MSPKEAMRNFEDRNADNSAYGRECAKKKTPPGESKNKRKAQKKLASRRLAHSSTIAQVRESASAYKTPGSMNPRS